MSPLKNGEGSGYAPTKNLPAESGKKCKSRGNTVFTRQDQGSDSKDSDVNPTTGRITPIALVSNQLDLTRDAGLVAPATITGTVFKDLDSDGIQTGGDSGLPGWQVFLDLNNDGQLGANEPVQSSDAATGGYQFSNLSPGDYHVLVVPQNGWRLTTSPQTGSFFLFPGQIRTGADFGEHPAQPGDADGDGNVGFSDLVKVAQNYGGTGKTFSDGDFNGDGVVGFADLVIVAQNYGTSAAPLPAAATPLLREEPVFATPIEVPVKSKAKPVFSTQRLKPTPVGREAVLRPALKTVKKPK